MKQGEPMADDASVRKNIEMDNMLCDLIDIHKVNGNEDALKRVLQSIYMMLDANKEVSFGTKLFDKLIDVMIANGGDNSVGRDRIAKVLDAVQVHTRRSKASENYLLQKLNSIALQNQQLGQGDQLAELLTLHPLAGQILEHLLDDFVRELGLKYTCSPQLFAVVQQLLQSELSDNRKYAYAIMQKLMQFIERSRGEQEDNQMLQCLVSHWPAYIVILEQLEQKESYLVLPMLSGHLSRFVSSSSQVGDWLSWLRILYVRLLDNHSVLVVRWSLEYFLMYSSINELRRVDLLDIFFDCINKTELYDIENYCLPELKIKMFVQSSGTLQFLEALVTVPWHSLPLVHWLRSMQPRQPHISKNLLFTICACVKSVQHDNLRFEAQSRIFDLFEVSSNPPAIAMLFSFSFCQPTIESFSLGGYIQFIKALCDNFCRDHKRFTAKIASCANITDEMVHFDKAFFAMIFRTGKVGPLPIGSALCMPANRRIDGIINYINGISCF